MGSELMSKLLEIARKRRVVLEQMRQAIEAGDNDSVLVLAKKLTGIDDEQRNRINSRVN
jgi:hypothetical protein